MIQRFGCSAQPCGTTRRIVSLSGSVEMNPRGSQPANIAVARWRFGALRLRAIRFHDPGPIGGGPLWSLKVAPAALSAVAAGRPSAPVRPSKLSPFEWATMNHGGTPDASSPPIMLPALVPTTYSALEGSQPVSGAGGSPAGLARDRLEPAREPGAAHHAAGAENEPHSHFATPTRRSV